MYLASNYCYRINAIAPRGAAVKASYNSTAVKDPHKPADHACHPQLLTALAALRAQGVRSLTYPNLL